MAIFQNLSLFMVALLLSGCSVLFGTIKPVAEKSSGYQVLQLHEEHSQWEKLDPRETSKSESASSVEEEENEDTKESDLVFQSKESASIISLNSACRARNATLNRNLEDFTELLFLGMTDIKNRETERVRISQQTALQTTLEGKMNQQPVKLRTIVLRKQQCIYDLMFVSQPERFDADLEYFDKFSKSLRLN